LPRMAEGREANARELCQRHRGTYQDEVRMPVHELLTRRSTMILEFLLSLALAQQQAVDRLPSRDYLDHITNVQADWIMRANDMADVDCEHCAYWIKLREDTSRRLEIYMLAYHVRCSDPEDREVIAGFLDRLAEKI